MAAPIYNQFFSSSTSVSSPSSTTVNVNTEPVVNNQSLVVFNVAFQAHLRLTTTNYFLWGAQWDALLIAYDIYGYVNGSFPCPESGSTPSDPTRIFWIRQEKFILNALLASINQDVSHLVSSAKTSYEVWTKLANTFAKPSRSHILRLRERLIKHQGNRSITDYLLDIKTTADELALLNHPVDTDDLILYIVNGLSQCPKDISTALRTRNDSLPFEELHEQLVEHEAYLHRMEPSHL